MKRGCNGGKKKEQAIYQCNTENEDMKKFVNERCTMSKPSKTQCL